MNDKLAALLVRHRVALALLSVLLVAGLAYGLRMLSFESSYRIFFGPDNPQLLAHDLLESTYSKSDNLTFVVSAQDGQIFTPKTLESLRELTQDAWTMPYSNRVDSVINFQHTHAEGDDLVVEDLVQEPLAMSAADLQRVRDIALHEPQLLNNLISDGAHVTAVSVDLTLPDVQVEADRATQEVVLFAREMIKRFEAANPNLKIYLIGQTVVNFSFNEMSTHDSMVLIPIMLLIIVAFLVVLVRSLWGTLATVVIIVASVLATQGLMGWLGVHVNQVNVASPIIILTLAVCDCVHLLNNYLFNLGAGRSREERFAAMLESLRINLQPVFLTSLTTAIGFLGMNFSDSPPFRVLGNVSAFGVVAAFVFSLTLFPALVMAMPTRARHAGTSQMPGAELIGNLVVRRRKPLLVGFVLVSVVLAVCMTRNELNDDTVRYFDTDVPFRQAADFTQANLTGFDLISYSLDSGEDNGISDPAFLHKVDAFAQWYLAQPEVVHVSAYTDILKRLNRNMHNDDPAWYRLPESRELAAQYLLLYEMSLPFGLDLTNQISLDQSALRLSVRVKDQKAQQLIDLDRRAQDWLQQNAPELVTPGASVSIMFAHIGQRNIESMLTGSLVTLVLVTLTLVLSLGSFKYGLVSLMPNALPAVMAFGLWGLFNGEVNLAVAVIFTITLGIVVDDTVHFMSKYLRGMRVHGYGPEKAMRYAFRMVGKSLVTTTVVLAAGFLVLATSSFNVNSAMGLMVAVTILIALVWDLLFLPALLISVDLKAQAKASLSDAEAAQNLPSSR